MTPSAVRQIAVPPDARAVSTLAHVDYADAFLVETEHAADRTAEDWVRAVLEDAPGAVRRMLRSGWSALGLELDRAPAERSVVGWEVRAGTPDLVLLGARSRVGMPAELLLRRERRALLFATFVQHGHPMARAVWAGVEPVHVSIVREVLERAARRWSSAAGVS